MIAVPHRVTFQPTDEQSTIFDHVASGGRSAIWEALAGSGKTTTIVQSLSQLDPGLRVLVLAFNVTVAKTMRQRIARIGRSDVDTKSSIRWAGARLRAISNTPNSSSTS